MCVQPNLKEISQLRRPIPVSCVARWTEPSSLRLSSVNPALKLNLPERDPTLVEEYSWEWGNFPQKTPVWTAFAAGGEKDVKGKGRDFFVDVAAEKACE